MSEQWATLVLLTVPLIRLSLNRKVFAFSDFVEIKFLVSDFDRFFEGWRSTRLPLRMDDLSRDHFSGKFIFFYFFLCHGISQRLIMPQH